VSIQSSSVKQPVGNIDSSNGTRPGVAGLMKAIMPGLARGGITVNFVLPGLFRTACVIGAGETATGAITEEQRARAVAIPLGRPGEPTELGSLIALLASERASYITGAAYQVDGGMIRSMWLTAAC